MRKIKTRFMRRCREVKTKECKKRGGIHLATAKSSKVCDDCSGNRKWSGKLK
tara:strand:- start:624 stop:779 length:156 start_codon:yes stop_codon:yes gene_type:complete